MRVSVRKSVAETGSSRANEQMSILYVG